MVSKQTRNAEACDRDLIQEVELLERKIFPFGSRGIEPERNPVELVEAILRRVSNTPRQSILVSFLHRLHRIDSKGVPADYIWSVLERLVRRSVLRQRTADSQASPFPGPPKLPSIRPPVEGPPSTPGDMPAATARMNAPIQDSYSGPVLSGMLGEASSTYPPPPIPPPVPACGLPPPPPPLGGLRGPLRPESAPSRVTPRSPTDGSSVVEIPQLLRTPLPRTQMKRLQWNKIPENRVTSSPGNLWIEVAGMFKGQQLNFERMEELFANAGSGAPSSCASANVSAGSKGRELPVPEGSSCERKTKKIDEINLIDNKRSMNVNIFLRQFRTTNVDIVNCLRSGDSQKLGPERLRSLLKVLPEPEDVQLLSAFKGERTQLGSAEKFYLELIALPNHRFLAECLLMKEEFPQTIDHVKPAIDAIILSARDVKDSRALHEILYTVLMAGNFLNSGVYSGNAAGFQLQSLLKLSELRANKPRMNLLHFVAQEIETKNPHLIDKLKNLKYLSEASQYSIEALLNDISTLQKRVRTISTQISTTELRFQQQMKDFLEMAIGEMEVLELDMRELEELRLELAAYFCEDAQSFKLDDCISTFNTFCKMFHKALEENRERHLQDLRAEERRRWREEQIAERRRSLTFDESRRSPDGSSVASPEVNGLPERRIQISQTMPSFLMDSSQDSSREASPCPGGGATAPNNRHRKRNSMSSNFLSRKALPQTPAGDESSNAVDRGQELLDVLLKTAASAEDSEHRRPGSSSNGSGSFRQRRRSRASVDILDRERAPSPSPFNGSGPQTETGSHPDGGHDQLDRGQPGRSSCPSRISSAQGRTQLLKDALLNQHAAHDAASAAAASADGQREESGGSCSSDAEVSAKQERENRRMERQRRSNVDSSISISHGDVKSGPCDTSITKPALGVTDQKMGPESNPSRANSAQENQHLVVPGRQAAEVRLAEGVQAQTIGGASNLTNGARGSSDDLGSEDVLKLTSTAVRRDAAKIRSLGDQRRWSSELERPGSGTRGGPPPSENNETGTDATDAGSMAKGASELNVSQTTHVKTADPMAPPRKPRLNSLIKQHGIPEQRISAGTKQNGGSNKNITNVGGTSKNEDESNKLKSQSHHRLGQRSDENLRDSTHLVKEGLNTGESVNEELRKTSETELDGASKSATNVANEEGDEGHHSEAVASSVQGACSQSPDSDEDRQKRWGKVFENDEKEATSADPASALGKREGGMTEGRPELLQSAAIRDYSELASGYNTVDRASLKRKEKLRKLSQLYSEGDVQDDLPKKPASTICHRNTDTNDHIPTEDEVTRAAIASTDQSSTQTTPSRESTDVRSGTDSFYSTHDEGFDSSEGHSSLCSASQRTSMSSTAESDIRITPMMTRKTYESAADGGEREAGDQVDRLETSALVGRTSIDSVVGKGVNRAAPTQRPIDATRRTSSALSGSLTKTSPKATTITSHTTGAKKGLAKTGVTQSPRTQAPSAAANRVTPRSVPSPANAASIAAVQYRIAKPNMVAVSRTPTPRSDNRAAKTISEKTATGSTLVARPSRTPVVGAKSPMKTEVKPKTAVTPRRQVAPQGIHSGVVGERAITQEMPVQSFVRGVGTRATVPADVLRENKKAAIESRLVRNIGPTPAPPRRTTSLQDANDASPAQGTTVPAPPSKQPSPRALPLSQPSTRALAPKQPSRRVSDLPPVELPASGFETACSDGKLTSRKASSEFRMPLIRTPRSTRIPDPVVRRLPAEPHVGDGKPQSGVSPSGVLHQRQRPGGVTPPVASVQPKVIHVAARPRTSTAISNKGKPKMPTSKTVSVSSLV